MLWWHWIILGLALAALELASPGGFFIIFFGAGAIIVGLLAIAGLGGPLWVQWLLFTVLSIVALRVFRDPLLRRMRAAGPAAPVDSLMADIATALEDIAPGEVGRAELRGTAWSARNVAQAPIAKGRRCVVKRVEGLLLHIAPEGA